MMEGETVLSGAEHPGTGLRVMSSPAGFYLGFADQEHAPYSRETEYLSSREAAELLLSWFRS